MIEKLLNALKKIPPKVKPEKSYEDYSTEFAQEPFFVSYNVKDYKVIAYELWRIIEDIQKAEEVTQNDPIALRSLIRELTLKRFIYLSNDKIKKISADVHKIAVEKSMKN